MVGGALVMEILSEKFADPGPRIVKGTGPSNSEALPDADNLGTPVGKEARVINAGSRQAAAMQFCLKVMPKLNKFRVLRLHFGRSGGERLCNLQWMPQRKQCHYPGPGLTQYRQPERQKPTDARVLDAPKGLLGKIGFDDFPKLGTEGNHHSAGFPAMR